MSHSAATVTRQRHCDALFSITAGGKPLWTRSGPLRSPNVGFWASPHLPSALWPETGKLKPNARTPAGSGGQTASAVIASENLVQVRSRESRLYQNHLFHAGRGWLTGGRWDGTMTECGAVGQIPSHNREGAGLSRTRKSSDSVHRADGELPVFATAVVGLATTAALRTARTPDSPRRGPTAIGNPQKRGVNSINRGCPARCAWGITGLKPMPA